ncbi:MAG: response regulator [Calditrichaeota bacterium]|nr:MAG: response regulator [Calditrichota bacterium]
METIVIADDSVAARMIIRRCLEIAGFAQSTFLEAADGAEALELAKSNRVGLLVTDLNMPNMDGRSLLRRIKASPRLTDVPVLVISSAGNEGLTRELKQEGAFDVLNKPVSPANLASILRDLTDQSEWG